MEPDKVVPISTETEFQDWLIRLGDTEREVWVGIYKKCSKWQSVTFMQLVENAICHGWIDVQTKGIDDQRYAIRFVPRKSGSSWSVTNRDLARRLIAEGRMTVKGAALLPPDL